MDERLWTFDDLKDGHRRFEELRNTEDPSRHYFYGIVLEMAGQPEEADEKYVAFRVEARRVFGDLEAGAVHYEAEAESFPHDKRMPDYCAHMVKILRREKEPGSDARKRRRSSCVIF